MSERLEHHGPGQDLTPEQENMSLVDFARSLGIPEDESRYEDGDTTLLFKLGRLLRGRPSNSA